MAGKRRLKKVAVVCLGLYLAYQAFILAYNYDSPFTWGVPWVGSYIVHKLVSAERAEHQGGEAYWLDVLKESDIPAFQRPALGDSEGVRKGQVLPAALYHTDSPSDPIFRVNMGEKLLFDGTIVVRNTRELYHFRRIHSAMFDLLDQESTKLAEWLAARSDTLPPQRLDALIYFSLEGPPQIGPTSPFWAESREHWRKIAIGKNPVCRLLALHAAHHWCENSVELTSVYDNSFHETNSLFHWTALHFIRALAHMKPEDLAKYGPFSGVDQTEVRALFRGRWTQLVEEFQRTHAGYDDGTVGGWYVHQDVQMTLESLAEQWPES